MSGCARCHGSGEVMVWDPTVQGNVDFALCPDHPDWVLSPFTRLRAAAAGARLAGLAEHGAVLDDIADQIGEPQ